MTDMFTRPQKFWLVAATLFAMLVTLIGAATPANAATTYGGVRVVDTNGDPVSGVYISVTDGTHWYGFYSDGLGESRFSESQPWAPFPSTVDGTLLLSYQQIGEAAVSGYVWTGGTNVELGGMNDENAASATFAAASSTMLTLVLPIDLAPGSISGRVSLTPGASGARIAQVSLLDVDTEHPHLAQVLSDASGNYTFTGVPAGSYKLLFQGSVTSSSSPDGFVAAYYPGTADFDDAQQVVVASGAVTGINQTLIGYSRVRGVLGSAADALEWPAIAFFPASWTSSTDWDSDEVRWVRPLDGIFDTRFDPGSYRVAFGDRVTGAAIGEWDYEYDFTPVEYWGGGADLSSSKVLTLSPGRSTTVNGLTPPTFSDVPQGKPFDFEITWLASTGITTGYPNGSFDPYGTVSRDAMAAFLYRFRGSPSFTAPAASPFSDVPTSNPFYKEITWLASTGITTGYPDGTFRPFGKVSRDAMAAFLYRFSGSPEFAAPGASPFSDVPTSNGFYKEITWLSSTGITTGYADGTFNVYGTVSRDAMAAFLYRLHSQPWLWS